MTLRTERIRTLDQIRAFLDGSEATDFRFAPSASSPQRAAPSRPCSSPAPVVPQNNSRPSPDHGVSSVQWRRVGMKHAGHRHPNPARLGRPSVRHTTEV